MQKFEPLLLLIRKIYKKEDSIHLHRPIFTGREKEYLNECIESGYVSSVGPRVSEFESLMSKYVGSKYAISTVNGTSALHIALLLSDVGHEDEVITQPLTFIATCNAISYCGALPVFIDVDMETLGMSPESLRNFLEKNCKISSGFTINVHTNRKIKACLPMHTFGYPCRIDQIAEICTQWNIALIEDSAESLGSKFGNKHTGTFGQFGTSSFNGNKIITTGGGGMIFTNNEELAKKAKHITTTAKIPHPYEFIHDEVGYNYRLPNINAALGCAQIENIELFLAAKKKIHDLYLQIGKQQNIKILEPLTNANSNHWLNVVILKTSSERNDFLDYFISHNISVRPSWKKMNELSMYSGCEKFDTPNLDYLSDRIVNLPSSVPFDFTQLEEVSINGLS